MIELLSLTTLATVTLLALAAATAFQWLLLHVTVQLIQPATARCRTAPEPAHPALAHGTAQPARAFLAHR
jgi:hypothetical protein